MFFLFWAVALILLYAAIESIIRCWLVGRVEVEVEVEVEVKEGVDDWKEGCLKEVCWRNFV